MGLLRRAIAIIVMMAFLPASVLAGTPLRLCVGEDGHRAIEFVLKSDHHSPSAVDAECDTSHDHQVAPSPECVDNKLLSATQKPADPLDLEQRLTLDDLLRFAVLATLAVSPASADTSEPLPRLYYVVLREPQLDALRTVVLLI